MNRLYWCVLTSFAILWLQPSALSPPRALWLWDPEPLLSRPDARTEFFDFCERHRIGVLWAQIVTRDVAPSRRLDRADDWKPFLAEAHRRQFKVHALDGDPHYALREQHAVALSIVDAVIAYNASAAPVSRFDGVHFDNEPHALLDWTDPVRRARLLADYLDLNEQAATKARRAGGLAYGVDIPFWWGERDPETGEPIGITTFRGARVVASDRLLEIVDNVGIMDHRTSAAGPDGIIARARETLRAAERASTARVYVGVETSVEHGDYWFVAGIPRAAIRAAMAAGDPAAALLDQQRARVVDDGAMVHVGIKASADAGDALARIARAFHLKSPDGAAAAAARSAMAAMRRDGEWLDVQPRTISTVDGSLTVIAATYATPPRVTFAGRSLTQMEAELSSAESEFMAYRAYAGIAIHDYASFRKIASALK